VQYSIVTLISACKERTEALKAKEKEHRDRVAELERLQQANIEELQKKIEQKVPAARLLLTVVEI